MKLSNQDTKYQTPTSFADCDEMRSCDYFYNFC